MRMEELTWPEFESLKERVNTVIIPIGSVEAHGKHLPLGTDVFAPLEIARRVEERLRGLGVEVLTAPPVWYGHTFVLNVYPGTINVGGDAFKAYVREIIKEFAAEGFRRIILLNGHGGNYSPLVLAAEEVTVDFPETEIWLINWWLDFREDILSICSSQGHAGQDETSVMLAIRPELVKMENARGEKRSSKVRIIKKDIGKELFPEGVNDDPSLATVEKGEAILSVVSEKIARLIAGDT
ncbi:creatininase family protein [Thermococcus thioreducens]|uniref:Amidase n=1 Tax=Thermococcus thioreducens TaxID=277988 RepID=A0A0Q2XKJ1_9EURY|nr:creatininase family protein [Thermococcus thioreducens]ASJ13102.1 amidase [Thermococcus thioreducens]KQH81612.1 amidase [Thermococcus thioreducens]SEV81128.1 creatinine amidohydrolase [Thermococcus thioreducens]